MFGFSKKDKPETSGKFTVAKSVTFKKDSTGSSAVDLSKVEKVGGVDLRKKAEAVGVSLQKNNLAGIRAQAVVLLDHSGSMYSDYANHKVQELVERFLGFALQIDVDGTVPVIAFDSSVHKAVDVTVDNYKGIVANRLWKPDSMGGTDLASALLELRKLAEDTDTPIFCAIVTDGEPENRNRATEIICELAGYPVFIKFLTVRRVLYLEQLDNLDSSKRLLDNVDTKEFLDLSGVTDAEFADAMADEWGSWVKSATSAGILK